MDLARLRRLICINSSFEDEPVIMLKVGHSREKRIVVADIEQLSEIGRIGVEHLILRKLVQLGL
jgi:hypothetical protein